MTLSSQGKLVKDAGSEVCSAHERPRTQIQRRHAGSGGESKKHAEHEAAREAVDRLQEQA
jgi:hypothetical protein